MEWRVRSEEWGAKFLRHLLLTPQCILRFLLDSSLTTLHSPLNTSSSGPGGIRTHSISHSECEWSPGCLPGRLTIRDEGSEAPTAFRFLFSVLCPLIHHPSSLIASTDPEVGLEPTSSGSGPEILPLNYSGAILISGRRNRTFTCSFKDCRPTD